MSKPAIDGKDVSRISAYLVPPEFLTMITDKKHALYDERVNLPLDMALVKSLMAVGSKVPIIVKKDGDKLLIVEGRQRYKAALKANELLKKDGCEPLKVKVYIESGTDVEMFGLSILTNELRQQDGVLEKAAKCKRYLDMGRTEEEAAVTFGVTRVTISNWVKINALPAAIRKAVETGKLSVTAAAKLAELEAGKQADALKKMLETPGKATVSKAKAIKGGKKKKGKKEKAKRSPLDPEFVAADVQAKLREICRYAVTRQTASLTEIEAECLKNLLADADIVAFMAF